MISIQTEDFDPAEEYSRLKEAAVDAGAIVIFTGLVREDHDHRDAGATPTDCRYPRYQNFP